MGQIIQLVLKNEGKTDAEYQYCWINSYYNSHSQQTPTITDKSSLKTGQ